MNKGMISIDYLKVSVEFVDIEDFTVELEQLLSKYCERASEKANWGYRMKVEGNAGINGAKKFAGEMETPEPGLQ